MNYSQVVQALDAILTQQKQKIEGFSQHAGGWEGWLQTEMTGQWLSGAVLTEQYIWGDRRRIDLWFPGTRFGVELKCFSLNRASGDGQIFSSQLSKYDSFVDDVLEDVRKVHDIPQGGSGMAVVVIPTWLPEEKIYTLKNKLGKETYRWMYMGNNGFVVGVHHSSYL